MTPNEEGQVRGRELKPDLFSLRPASETDDVSIAALTWAEGMDTIYDLDKVTVAVNNDDEVVGCIRLQEADGFWYVNPIVTHGTWRGYGVGAALIQMAIEKHGELRLVARGKSVGFYEKLGFLPISWELVAEAISSDCTDCEMYDECHPLPMRYQP